jgi:hypothetical protein
MSNSISLKNKYTKTEAINVNKITEELVCHIPKTIKHFFPHFKRLLRKIEDYRKAPGYELSEIIMAAITMFILKQDSRNAYNNERRNPKFLKNYEELFAMSLPHMDTVNDVYRIISPEELERFKVKMVEELLEKKALHKWRLLGKYFVVAIDGTGVMSFDKRHCDKCLVSTYESGKRSYFHNVLEAKLVSPIGLSISLGTEWIENDGAAYDKQDSELKAFKRLSVKLKKYFPRLPICIVGDGLYPNKPVFDICKQNRWEYIITLKDGNLPTVWEEIKSLLKITTGNKLKTDIIKPKEEIITTHQWINEIDYKGTELNWIETKEKTTIGEETTTKRFVYVSSFKISKKNAARINQSGRLRWKIENEGFNQQKNRGYNLEHLFSEVSLNATKNYYQSLQIAHMINQLLELGQKLKSYLKKKITIKYLWEELLAFLKRDRVDREYLKELLKTRNQIRLE